MTHLKNIILDTVKKQNIRMIPKWKFVLYSFLGVFSIIFLFIISTFLLSLIFFVLSRYGFMDMPLFGFVHSLETLRAVPLPLFICAVFLLIVTESLARHYSFSFKRPLLITLFGAVALVTLSSFVISRTPIHEYVEEYAKKHHLGMVSRAYDRPMPFRKQREGMDVVRGEIIERVGGTLTLKLFDGKLVTAHGTTTVPFEGIPPFAATGDDVVLLGNFKDGIFEIENMRPSSKKLFGGLRRNHGGPLSQMEEER